MHVWSLCCEEQQRVSSSFGFDSTEKKNQQIDNGVRELHGNWSADLITLCEAASVVVLVCFYVLTGPWRRPGLQPGTLQLFLDISGSCSVTQTVLFPECRGGQRVNLKYSCRSQKENYKGQTSFPCYREPLTAFVQKHFPLFLHLCYIQHSSVLILFDM